MLNKEDYKYLYYLIKNNYNLFFVSHMLESWDYLKYFIRKYYNKGDRNV